MASPRAEFRTARLVVVATIVLALGVLIVGTLMLLDDYQTRSDQRALASSTSEESLEQRLATLDEDLDRGLAAVEEAGLNLADRISASEDTGDVALASAVIDAQLGRTLPALDRVIYQDAVAAVFGVDEFGSPTASPLESNYNTNVANSRPPDEPFADRQGQVYFEDGIAAYYPVPVKGGWVVLILQGNEMAAGSTFTELAEAGSVGSAVELGTEAAVLRAAQPFVDSVFVTESQVDLPGGEPASWIPFLIRLFATLATLGGVLVLGSFVRKNYEQASRRLQNAESTPYGSSTDFEANIIGVVELDEICLLYTSPSPRDS